MSGIIVRPIEPVSMGRTIACLTLSAKMQVHPGRGHPMDESHLLEQAIAHHRAGRLADAQEVYRLVLRSRPDHFDALHMLGAIAYQQGDDDQALNLLHKALTVNSTQPTAFNHLGMVELRRGEYDAAADHFRRAVALDPKFVQAHDNLGTAHRLAGRLQEAAGSYRQAIATDPSYANAHYNLGGLLRAGGDLAGAADLFRHALQLAPNLVGAIIGLGEVLIQLRRPGEAIPVFSQALALRADDPLLHCGLADARQLLGELGAAVTGYERAVTLEADCDRAWWGLGCALLKQKEYARAATAFERVASLRPDFPGGHHNLGQALFELGQTDRAVGSLRRANVLSPNRESRGAIATIIPGDPQADNEAILAARRDWANQDIPPTPATRPTHRPPSEGRPLRVGYFSSFFEDRNWMKPVWGLINHHDRERVAVHLFSDAPESKIQHGYIKDSRDRFHDLSHRSNEEAAQLIAAEEIEILVDLNSYSRPERLRLFALKPAPVLVAWFNAFATTGMKSFDYIIGDEHVVRPDEQRYYTERIVRVPGCYLTFEVTYPVPDVVAPPCLSRKHITFGCLAPQYKITTHVIEAWSRILREIPESRLVLKNRALGSSATREFVAAMFGRFGIDRRRYELDGPEEHFAFLGKYAEIDIALDTFPYNGGTTTMESLWQGVPLLSFVGDRWAGRIGASMMRNAGLGEWVAPDLDGHIRQAIRLAHDPDTPGKLAALRQSMRERLCHAPVCDVRGFARNMEAAYLRMATASVPPKT